MQMHGDIHFIEYLTLGSGYQEGTRAVEYGVCKMCTEQIGKIKYSHSIK